MATQFTSSSHHHLPLSLITGIVIALHFLLLIFGNFWKSAPSDLKPRNKVMVQTVQLRHLQPNTFQNNPSSLMTSASTQLPSLLNQSVENSDIDHSSVFQSIKNEAIKQSKDGAIQVSSSNIEDTIPDKDSSPSPIFAPKPIPSPSIKKEHSPDKIVISPKKTIPQTGLKINHAPPNPTKKTAEPIKKTTQSKTIKSKKVEENEKKQQQEKIEAEKKRQQEIATIQETARQKEQILLAKAKEKLAKVNETRDKISSSSANSPKIDLDMSLLPKELGNLQVDTLPIIEIGGNNWEGVKESNYVDEVAYRLKIALRLPDYGTVKIKLTLDRTGKVIKVETMHSESMKNKSYIESKVPTLLFPPFGQRFQGASQNTFIISLQND